MGGGALLVDGATVCLVCLTLPPTAPLVVAELVAVVLPWLCGDGGMRLLTITTAVKLLARNNLLDTVGLFDAGRLRRSLTRLCTTSA